MRKCKICGEEIHPKRVEILPHIQTCVSCSTTGKKAGISVVVGEGDHTYNETIILEQEEYMQVQELERRLYGTRKDDIQHPDEEEDTEDDDEDNLLEGIEEIGKVDFEDLEE